jgi:peptidoglycan/xylan/chitin deacetylase (PgdA/CDA1 family)
VRLDRSVTLGLPHPFRNAGGPGERVPILMYHSISNDPEAGAHPYHRICTSPARFAEQMAWLESDGWKGMTLTAGLAHFSANRDERLKNTPTKPVVITFDDGFRDFHEAAFPVLARHGFSATMYLPTAFIGHERKPFKPREYMTWGEVRGLHAQGIEFGSHTVNHPLLVQLPWPDIETELRDSRAELEKNLGSPIRHFAYPYAFPQAEKAFAAEFVRLLARVGYESAVTTMIGRSSPQTDRFTLPRLPVNSDDDRALLRAKLAGAYDWLGVPQALSKTVGRWLRPRQRPAAMDLPA